MLAEGNWALAGGTEAGAAGPYFMGQCPFQLEWAQNGAASNANTQASPGVG